MAAAGGAGEQPDIFQLRNSYRTQSRSNEGWRVSGTVQAGDRAPDAPLELTAAGPARLFEFMQGAEWTCICFGVPAARACATATNRHDPLDRIRVLEIPADSPTTAAEMRRIYDVAPGDEAVFLVRPDGYVGLTADHQITERVANYLSRVAAAP